MAYVRKRRSVKGIISVDTSLSNTDDVVVLKQRLDMCENLLTKSHSEMVSQDSIHEDQLERIFSVLAEIKDLLVKRE